jgi:hypothetical protein
MSLTTLFLIVFVLFPIAALLMLLVLCLFAEYSMYRGKQESEKQLKDYFGEDEDDVDSETQSDIPSFSQLPPSGV